jgi:hypothetical protein
LKNKETEYPILPPLRDFRTLDGCLNFLFFLAFAVFGILADLKNGLFLLPAIFFAVLLARNRIKQSAEANSKKEEAGKNPEGEEPEPPPPPPPEPEDS